MSLWSFYKSLEQRWKQADRSGPSGRWGATLTRHEVDHSLWLFGGFATNPAGETQFMNDLHQWKAENGQWEARSVKGGPIPVRSNHTTVALKDGIYIYGGSGPHRAKYADLWKVLLPSCTAERVTPKSKFVPEARANHAAVALDSKRFVVIGGSGRCTSRDLSDVVVFDAVLQTWHVKSRLILGMHSEGSLYWNSSPSNTRSTLAKGFKFHTVNKLDQNRLVVYGGCDEVYEPTNQVWILTFDASYREFTIQAISCSFDASARVPVPRRWGHCAEVYQDSHRNTWLYIGGGKGDLEQSCPNYRIRLHCDEQHIAGRSREGSASANLANPAIPAKLGLGLAQNIRSESTKSAKNSSKFDDFALQVVGEHNLGGQMLSSASLAKYPRKMSYGCSQATRSKQPRAKFAKQRLLESKRKTSEHFCGRAFEPKIWSTTRPTTHFEVSRHDSSLIAEPVCFSEATNLIGLRRPASCLVRGVWFVFGGFDGKEYSNKLSYCLLTNIDDSLGFKVFQPSKPFLSEAYTKTEISQAKGQSWEARLKIALKSLEKIADKDSNDDCTGPSSLESVFTNLLESSSDFEVGNSEGFHILLECSPHLKVLGSPVKVPIPQHDLVSFSMTMAQLISAHGDSTERYHINLPAEFLLMHLLNKSKCEVAQAILEDGSLVSEEVMQQLRELSDYLLCPAFTETLRSSTCRRRLKTQVLPEAADSSLTIFFKEPLDP